MGDVIVNKVANSGLVTIDLETFLSEPPVAFDLKDHLFRGLILKEKDFREALKKLDWNIYGKKNVAIFCSADAIIPVWAYMLVAVYLEPVANEIYVGTTAEMRKHLLLKNISALEVHSFTNQRVVVKGCGDVHIDEAAYAAITQQLRPVAKTILYGEPCSTVPIYKAQGKDIHS